MLLSGKILNVQSRNEWRLCPGITSLACWYRKKENFVHGTIVVECEKVAGAAAGREKDKE